MLDTPTYLTQNEDLNLAIRELAAKAKIAIMQKQDKNFTEYTVQMIEFANFQSYREMANEIKDIIHGVCHSLYQDDTKGYNSKRVDIANEFYMNIVNCCRLFLN